jgi:transcriptional regulator with XRE-family HTH domain
MRRREREPDAAAMALAGRIKTIMQSRGMTQTALALKAGIDRTDLNRFLNGHRGASLEELRWIAEALGLAVEELASDVTLPENAREALGCFGTTLKKLRQAEAERDEARARIVAVESQSAHEREQWFARMASLEHRLDRLEQLLRHSPSTGNTPGEVSNVQLLGADAAMILTIGLLGGSIIPVGRN